MNINIDGLPFAKSSQSQLWPILGQIYNVMEFFLIGTYYGYKKPMNVRDLFLNFFRYIHTIYVYSV